MFRPINLDIKLNNEKCMPHKGSEHACAWDLRSAEETFELKPGKTKEVHTGVYLEMPKHMCALILPRSGLGRKYELRLKNTVGLIDPDYRGELICVMKATSTVEIEQYSRFAQILFLPFIEIVNMRVKETLSKTARGEGGFGHSGVN